MATDTGIPEGNISQGKGIVGEVSMRGLTFHNEIICHSCRKKPPNTYNHIQYGLHKLLYFAVYGKKMMKILAP